MDLLKKHCVPCEGGAKPLTTKEEEDYLKHVSGWLISEKGTHTLSKQFKFKDFKDVMIFVNRIAGIAEQENHHPDMAVSYSRVSVALFTHAINGLSMNDFILAAKIDAAAGLKNIQ